MNKKHIQTMICSLKIALKKTSKKFNKTKNKESHYYQQNKECLKFFEYITVWLY